MFKYMSAEGAPPQEMILDQAYASPKGFITVDHARGQGVGEHVGQPGQTTIQPNEVDIMENNIGGLMGFVVERRAFDVDTGFAPEHL